MRKRQITRAVSSFVCSVILLWGCASVRSPRGWLPKLEEAQSQAYGCWIIVDHVRDGQEMTTSGELIAVSWDRLFILNESSLSEIPISTIKETDLELFREKNVAGIWATLGTLSTLSHGYFLIASGPIWIIGGIASGISESESGLMNYKGPPPRDIRKYARFPQGLPKDIDLGSLRKK